MNHVDFFRFNGRYCDVFCEDGHYLYAEAEPTGWAHMVACNEYRGTMGDWVRGDTDSADVAYLASLERAPEDVARDIVATEHLRSWVYDQRADGVEPDSDDMRDMWQLFHDEA